MQQPHPLQPPPAVPRYRTYRYAHWCRDPSLRDVIEEACRKVARWPAWKRAYITAEAQKSLAPPHPHHGGDSA